MTISDCQFSTATMSMRLDPPGGALIRCAAAGQGSARRCGASRAAAAPLRCPRTWAVCTALAAYAVARSLQRWPKLSSLPPRHRWYFWLRLPLCLAWAALATLLLLPKWG